MKQLKTTLVLLLAVTLPAWSLYAAVPELVPFWTDNGSRLSEDAALLLDAAVPAPMLGEEPAQVPAGMLGLLEPANKVIADESLMKLSDQDLEAALQDDLTTPQDAGSGDSFWKSKKFIGGVLLTLAVVSIVAFLFGVGEGGASGSGSGGNNNNGGNPFNAGPKPPSFPPVGGPPLITPGPGPNPGPGGLPGGEGNNEGFLRTSIPNNPEPSTMILLFIGLALLVLRKGKLV